MASSVMASVALKPAPFTVEKSSVRGLPSLSRNSSSFRVVASGGKKIKTDTPYGWIAYMHFLKHFKHPFVNLADFCVNVLQESVVA